VFEFAKCSENYFLSWDIETVSLRGKILSQLKALSQRITLSENILSIPLLFRPVNMATAFNTKVLNYAVKKYKIDVVVNANALLFDVKHITVPVFYDLVDDHLSPNAKIGLTHKRIKKIKEDIQCSQGVICVTELLRKKVQSLHDHTITIENGLYVDRFKHAKPLKKEMHLEDKKVYGYIGGVEEWTGIDKACEAYMHIQRSDNAMIVVGDSKSIFFKNLKQKYHDKIIFTGLIPPEKVGDYFKTLDVGLIPFDLSDFTHNAYPIKALEYALAGAQVISTPLNVLKMKNLPFIHFSSIEDFAEAMQKIQKQDIVFDFESLDWKHQTKKLIHFIEKNNEQLIYLGKNEH